VGKVEIRKSMYFRLNKGKSQCPKVKAYKQAGILRVRGMVDILVLSGLQFEWMRLPHHREVNLLYSVYQFKCNLIQNTLTEMLRLTHDKICLHPCDVRPADITIFSHLTFSSSKFSVYPLEILSMKICSIFTFENIFLLFLFLNDRLNFKKFWIANLP
jgi:hypothetical protein